MTFGIIKQFLKIPSKKASIRLFNSTTKVFASTDYNLDDDGIPIDYKEIKLVLLSRRLDNLISKAFANNSAYTEKIISSGNVRINEMIIKKKAHEINEDDNIEIWLKLYEDNSDLAVTNRLQVTKLNINEKGYNFNIKYWKEFLIENWK